MSRRPGGAPALLVAVVAAAALAVPVPGVGAPVPPAGVATPAAVSAADAGDAHVVAVGDIAAYTGLDDAIADLVAGLSPESLLLLGDIAYPSGSTEDFDRWFAPDWARFSGIWMPVPGNHEYRTDGVAGYRSFFDVPTGPLYSTARVGAWRVIGLDSETPTSAAQLDWLRSTLAAHDGEPTLVMWHRPRYSSGQHGDQGDMDALWDVVAADPDVQLALWGHDHDYERMAVPVAGRAPLTAMVVGTGGGELRSTPVLRTRPWREFYVDGTTGVLDLRLGATSFSWSFIDVDGRTLDSGSQAIAQQIAQPQPPPIAQPQRRASVKVRAVKSRSKLRVNVNPNRGSRYWTFKVKRKRADGTWAGKGTYRTRRAAETRTINLPKGTYRVRVRPKFGHLGTLSRSVTLRR